MEPIFEIKEEKKEEKYGKFVISPLVAGYGDTMGSALRRVLLTSLKGAAITKVKITGAKHQFSTLKGMKEDVLDFLLNLKKVRIEYNGDEPVKATISVKTAGEVKASDIKTPANVRIANPELVLASLSKGAKLEAELEISSGIGYRPIEEGEKSPIGVIPLDASFSPIVRVVPKVEETRVGRVTDYDKLILEVWTDGTIDPKEAIVESSRILVSYFNQVINPKKVEVVEEEKEDEGIGPVGKLSVEEIGLPTRVANALAKAGFDTVEKLVNAKREDLVKVRNLGDKSAEVINKALKEKGVQLNNA